MNILVTGGAGYIGSVLTEELVRQGSYVVVLDTLQQGHRAAVVPEAALVQADLADREALEDILPRHKIEVVMHLAADISVEQSMVEPGKFLQNNVFCGLNLLEAMVRHGVNKLVFSSSAAVYGQSEEPLVTEASPANPANVYGESKLIFERILYWYGRIHGISSVSFRYFNVAGASRRFGADHHPETTLIPTVLKVALGKQDCLSIFGADYATRDGTCIRDYIHVLDIARAHIQALARLGEDEGSRVYNLGNGEGYSVMEVIEAARRVTGAEIPVEIVDRRPGDTAKLVASSMLAEREIHWKPEYADLDSIVGSAWEWQKKHPQGYRSPPLKGL